MLVQRVIGHWELLFSLLVGAGGRTWSGLTAAPPGGPVVFPGDWAPGLGGFQLRARAGGPLGPRAGRCGPSGRGAAIRGRARTAPPGATATREIRARAGRLQVSGSDPSARGRGRRGRPPLPLERKRSRPASFPASAGARLPRGRGAPLPPAWRAASLSLRGSPPPRQMAVGRKLDALSGRRARRGGGEGAPRGRPALVPEPGRGRGGMF